MAGRPPKPTMLKLLQGNPGKRPINRLEPKPRVLTEPPPMPDWLCEEAREEWQRVMPELLAMRMISALDVACLALYCQAYGRMVQAEKAIEQHAHEEMKGLINVAQSGYETHSGMSMVSAQQQKHLLRYLTEFGMSPSSRAKLRTEPEKGDAAKAEEGDKWANL